MRNDWIRYGTWKLEVWISIADSESARSCRLAGKYANPWFDNSIDRTALDTPKWIRPWAGNIAKANQRT